MHDLLIKVFARDTLLATFEMGELAGQEDVELSQPIRIQHKDLDVLRCDIAYDIAGQSQRETIETPITIKTMTQAKFDFDVVIPSPPASLPEQGC